MSEMKKYMDIVRLGHKSTIGVLSEGDHITITEKLDGANASFKKENGVIRAFSRNTELNGENNLRGFYQWTQTLIPELLTDGVVYFGEWLCLSGDTIIRKLSGGRKTGNYMTLKEMYEYSIKPLKDREISQWEKEGYPSIYSLFINEDVIKPNKIANITYTGKKTVYQIKTRKGFTIKASDTHPFLTNKGWKTIRAGLKENDCVAVSSLRTTRESRRLGRGSRKIKALWDRLKTNRNCEDCGNETCLEIHHKDGSYKNNKLENLQVLCSDCHSKKHLNVTGRPKGYQYEFDKITSIHIIGEEDCYDISMEGSENEANFIANGFVVHNCKHKIQYPIDKMNQFYLFDIYDENNNTYLDFTFVKYESNRLGLNLIPLFYEGEYQSFDHLMSFVGKTALGGEQGEGVVVKNADYRDRYGKQVFVKLVTDSFREIQKQKAPKDPNRPLTAEQQFVNECVTVARVDKLLHKLVDEGILDGNFSIEDMGLILKNLGSRVYEDIIKEESDSLPENYEVQLIRKSIGRKLPLVVKEIIKERN